MGSASLDEKFPIYPIYPIYPICPICPIRPIRPIYPIRPIRPIFTNKKDGQGCPAVVLFLCSLKALHMLVARRVADVLDKALDVLLLAAWAYHQHIVGVHNDIVLQTADNGHLIFGCEYHRVAGVVGLY